MEETEATISREGGDKDTVNQQHQATFQRGPVVHR